LELKIKHKTVKQVQWVGGGELEEGEGRENGEKGEGMLLMGVTYIYQII
jgi:hypothetical protein